MSHFFWELITLGGLLNSGDLIAIVIVIAGMVIWHIYRNSGNIDG